jgi:hypothetical protein
MLRGGKELVAILRRTTRWGADMSERRNARGISRRDFGVKVGAAAGLAVGAQLAVSAQGPGTVAATAPASGRILGANDRVVVAVVGIRGQGNALKRGFARLENVEVKTLADIDANLAPSRVNDTQLTEVATFKPGFVQDMRRVLDDPDIDAVVIATPNHWHALHAIWSLQAGKHVYVEKPSSHTVLEGRREIEAVARYGKLLQVGTMNRSRPAVIDAIRFIHEGGLGAVPCQQPSTRAGRRQAPFRSPAIDPPEVRGGH